MSSDVEKIKERLGIKDVIESYLSLEKAGSNFKSVCPFHNEKTPSFFISPSRNSYYCFGCGAKGDIFTFVEEFEGLDFPGALKLLADRAGVELTQRSKKDKEAGEKLYRIMDDAVSFYEEELKGSDEAKKYLTNRGIHEKTLADYRIGFARDEWRSLLSHLEKQGYTRDEIQKAGLIKESEEGKQYDRFRNRIMFPLSDSAGRPIAFSGRLLSEEGETVGPKYLNSPETPLFNKSVVLYGYDRAKQSMRKNNFCILVEGQMDLLMSHQAGFRNTVALSGTSLTAHHIALIQRLTKNLVLALDADTSGIASTLKSAGLALSAGMDVKVPELKEGEDPADIILRKEDDWKVLIRNSKHVISFFFNRIQKLHPDRRDQLRAVVSKLLPLIARIENSVDAEHFLKLIASDADISENALREELDRVKEAQEKGDTVPSMVNVDEKHFSLPDVISRRQALERAIVGILILEKEQKDTSLNMEEIEEKLKEVTGSSALFDMSSDGMHDEYVFEAEARFGPEAKTKEIVAELLLYLEHEVLLETLEEARKSLKEAESVKDEEETQKMLQKCQELSQRIQKVKDLL